MFLHKSIPTQDMLLYNVNINIVVLCQLVIKKEKFKPRLKFMNYSLIILAIKSRESHLDCVIIKNLECFVQ